MAGPELRGVLRGAVAGLAVACVLVACGSRGDPRAASTTRQASTSSAPTIPVKRAHLATSAASPRPVRADPHTAAVITRRLIAVFGDPQSAQCTSAMTPRYVAQAFRDDAARSAISPMAECRVHQRQRAELPASERRVTVPTIELIGGSAHAIVRGANGYPIGVTLSERGGTWLLDGFGVPAAAGGQGAQVAPVGSLYAYRIPPGFFAGDTSIGAVETTGAAYSTSVVLPGISPGQGVAVAQSALRSGIHSAKALRAILPELDRGIRTAPLAHVVGPPVTGKIGGRLSLSWDLQGTNPDPAHTDGRTVIVFSSAANFVVVNCRWPQAGPNRTALRNGCTYVLASLAVG